MIPYEHTWANVLITGGSGFVGYWTLKTSPRGLGAAGLCRLSYDAGYWYDMRWDYIIHAAHVAPTRVLECAKRNNARVLYVSSGIVYHPEKLDDKQYRDEKLAWEQECQDSGVDVVIARLFAFYGEPNLSAHHAIVAFENAAKAGEPIHIFGDGSTVRSYMRGEEMGRWLWAILLRGARGESYDVGDDTPVTMLELARRFTDNIIIENGVDDMPHYLPPNTAKTRALLHD